MAYVSTDVSGIHNDEIKINAESGSRRDAEWRVRNPTLDTTESDSTTLPLLPRETDTFLESFLEGKMAGFAGIPDTPDAEYIISY